MWLTANKISLNNDKTELIYFHKAKNVIPSDNKIKSNGKRFLPSMKIKYLGVYLDEKLSGESHCEELIKKLNRANGMLAKARHYAPLNELKNVYHAIFLISSHLMYGCQIWSQKLLSVTGKISILQKNDVRIMTYSALMLTVNLYSNNWIFLNSRTILFYKIVFLYMTI